MEINSNKVFIYPSGYRQYNEEGSESPVNVNPESRLNTEFNIVKSINSLVPTINQGNNTYKDSGSFIVDYSNNVLEFYVHGYWFKIIDFIAPNTDLYASIKLVDRANESEDYSNLYELCPILYNTEGKNLDKLDGQVAKFIGLSLNTTPHLDATYTLQLFEGGELCVENKAKLTTNDVYDETRNKLISDEFDTNLLHSQFVEANEINNIKLNYNNNNITLSGNNRTVNVPLVSTPSTVSYINQPQTITADKTINSEFVFHTDGQPDINISGSGIKVETNNQSLAEYQIIDILYMWGTQYGQGLQILSNGTIEVFSGELTTAIKPGEIDVDYLNTYDLEVTRYLNNIKFTNTTSDAINLNAVVGGDICVLNQPQEFTQPKTRAYNGYVSKIFPTESSVALSIANGNKTTKYGYDGITFGANNKSLSADANGLSYNGDLSVTNLNVTTKVKSSNVETNLVAKGKSYVALSDELELLSYNNNSNNVSVTLDGTNSTLNCKKVVNDTTIEDFDLFTRMDGIDNEIVRVDNKIDDRVPLTESYHPDGPDPITEPGVYAITHIRSDNDTYNSVSCIYIVPEIPDSGIFSYRSYYNYTGTTYDEIYCEALPNNRASIRFRHLKSDGTYHYYDFSWKLLIKY